MATASNLGTTYRTEAADHRTPPLDVEWLLTNGTGTYAMGTAGGCNTRRYHGLLVAATEPPVGRVVTLHSIGEHLRFNNLAWDLDTHEFGAGPDHSMFHPSGWRHMAHFDKDLAATWTYRVGPIEVVKKLRLLWKKPTAVVTYTVRKARGKRGDVPDRVDLHLRPFFAMRDFHQLRNGPHLPAIDLVANVTGDGLAIQSGALTVHIAADDAAFRPQPDWWHNLHYRADAARGQDCRESLWAPGVWQAEFDPKAKATLTIVASLEEIDFEAAAAPDARRRHLRPIAKHIAAGLAGQPADQPTRKPTRKPTDEQQELAGTLAIATDDFVVERAVDGKASTTLMAGYPWFSDWGRDTMIALPGCLLATGRFKQAKQTLLTFAAHIEDGLVPNRFDDYGGDPHYNTVDASLWFVHAALEYRRLSGDRKTWNDALAEACREILTAYADGTRYNIRAENDGLITAGDPGTQLTWMDAARDGVVFTPRHGKAVEINALWYAGLVGMAEACAAHANDKGKDKGKSKDKGKGKSKAMEKFAARCTKLAAQVNKSFNKVFWLDDHAYLADHITPDGHVDTSLRINQVFAVSLPRSPLPPAKQKQVMAALREKLYTPMGMRTLAPDDPAYIGRYAGSMFDRDRAYHQGTVWPWPTGAFIEGWLRAHKFSTTSRDEARAMLAPLIDQLAANAPGTLHEVYDGDAPHQPNGCIAQAWSVSELLRAALLIESP